MGHLIYLHVGQVITYPCTPEEGNTTLTLKSETCSLDVELVAEQDNTSIALL